MQRTTWIKTVDGGLSRLTRDILREVFINDRAHEGFPLQLLKDHPPTIVRFRLSMVVGDEEALNQIFYTKGASGISPCLLCCVTNKPPPTDGERGIASLRERDALIPDITCNTLEQCVPNICRDIWKMVEDLRSCPQADLAEKEHVSGLKFHSQALLFCPQLKPFIRPSRIVMYDAMHVVFSNGILPQEIALCLHRMKAELGIYFADVRQFMHEKNFRPKTKSFSEAREKSCVYSLKAGASELLSDYVMMRAFMLEMFGAQPIEPYIQCIMLLFQICDCIRSLLHWPSPAEVRALSATLRSLIAQHHQAFTDLYGRDSLKFKHHQLLHLPKMIEEFGAMIACWVLERKHLLAKQSIQNCKNVVGIESTGLARMLNSQANLLQEAGWSSQMIPPLSDFPELAPGLAAQSVQLASRMRFRGIHLGAHDVLFMDRGRTHVYVVVGCLSVEPIYGDTSYALLVKLCRCATRGDFASTWDVDPNVSLYRLRDDYICKPAFWRYLKADLLELLH